MGADEGEQLLRASERGLLRLGWLLTGEQQAAEDLVQETLLLVWRHRGRLPGMDHPQAYLRKVLVRHARRTARVPWRSLEGVEPVERSDAVRRVDEQDQLRRALLQLPLRRRAAVVLRHYEGLTESETALAMGCTVGAVKSATSRGLAELRRHLQEESHD